MNHIQHEQEPIYIEVTDPAELRLFKSDDLGVPHLIDGKVLASAYEAWKKAPKVKTWWQRLLGYLGVSTKEPGTT